MLNESSLSDVFFTDDHELHSIEGEALISNELATYRFLDFLHEFGQERRGGFPQLQD